MKINKFSFLFLLCTFLTNAIIGQDKLSASDQYLSKTHEKDGQSLNYRILYPVDFDESKTYPLVAFLHGMGERGSGNNKQLTHGSKLFADSLEKYPAVVIFPQCPENDYWANLSRPDEGGRNRIFTFHTDRGPNPSLALVMDLMDEMIEKDFIDDDRVYVSGLSMGAMGAWELLWRMPEKIAAAIPICGGGAREKAPEMINIPIWIFHGIKDDVVHPRYSTMMMKAIQAAGGKAKISLYPEANHNSWDPAFAEPKFLSWLFSKRKIKS